MPRGKVPAHVSHCWCPALVEECLISNSSSSSTSGATGTAGTAEKFPDVPGQSPFGEAGASPGCTSSQLAKLQGVASFRKRGRCLQVAQDVKH